MSTPKDQHFDDYTTEGRLRQVIQRVTNGKTDWKNLEEQTGVPAEKWRNFHRGQTKVSVEMIEAVATKWPQYAFWLVTGINDFMYGHTQPFWKGEKTDEPGVPLRERTAAWDLFRKEIEYKQWCRVHGTKQEPIEDEAHWTRISFWSDLIDLEKLRIEQQATIAKLNQKDEGEINKARWAKGEFF